mgnify:CR=1 FL=1
MAMIERIIRWSLAHRALVLAATVLLTIASLLSVRGLALDAIPDLSDVQVIIRTPAMGQAPQIVEDQITYPITTRMLALPKAKAVRGFSFSDARPASYGTARSSTCRSFSRKAISSS